jgi:glucosamine-6-phosphate deaminase
MMLISNTPKTFQIDKLSVNIYPSEVELAQGAAHFVREYLISILDQQTEARLLLATGNTQIQFLDALIALGGVDWSRLVLFHLDEYLGVEAENTASFCYYLRERVEKKVKPKQFHYIKGNATEPLTECDRYANLLNRQSIDLCFLGIGQNGHIAFNEPSVANFDDPYWVKLVKLEESTRQTQVKQDNFPHINTVPQYAYTVTIPTILSAKKIICLASGMSKAEIVKSALEGEITVACPVSILRQHPDTHLLLDVDSASLL